MRLYFGMGSINEGTSDLSFFRADCPNLERPRLPLRHAPRDPTVRELICPEILSR